MSAETLPASWYAEPSIYTEERERVFSSAWLVLAHVAELPEPEDCLAVEVAGWPLLLTRDREGRVRGFHNVCRHRAGPLLWPGEATRCKVLRCRYHGWQYDLDGRLLKRPRFGDEREPPAGSEDLFEIAIEVRHGLVFAYIGQDPPAIDLALAPTLELLSEVHEQLLAPRFHSRTQHDIACNWKAYVENYLEGYHIPELHKSLTQDVDVAEYRVRPGAGYVKHEVPDREGVYAGLWAWLWPNTAINVYREGLSLERIVPTGPHTTTIHYSFAFNPDVDPAPILSMCDRVTLEDKRICEVVQRNLEAGVYERGRLSPRHEQGVARFVELLRGALTRA